ncbi:universal stress protein [Simiduia curdlanivorans]|uniref:Universal stress protein n=1 Tax=Simiduia curdlanivorans TaxID=1492769 RepID=A0ABV8VAJ6_9GAMM|nr:universal stress protein [Simiduia curdlanivorans]MDN3639560.1 universal stress protein [Simiduia curdlanivorans]
MNSYQHIVVGVDLSPESHQVIERAVQIAKNHNAKLLLAHIIEPLAFAYGGDIPMDLTEVQEQLQTQAKGQLHKLAQQFAIDQTQCHLLVGQPAAELHQLATEHKSELIIVGSHGRRGLALILGSTANGVLHGAHCDVLAVRIQER